MYFSRALSKHLNNPVVIESMKERKGLSLAEEMGILLEKMKGPEKEDFIQSYLYLIREEKPEEVKTELSWEVTSTSVASAQISVLIDHLFAFGLMEYSSNPGYMLTEKGKKILLKDIPEDLKNKYSERCERIACLGDNTEIVKVARKKYLEKRRD